MDHLDARIYSCKIHKLTRAAMHTHNTMPPAPDTRPRYPWLINSSLPTNQTKCENVTIIGKNIDIPGGDLGPPYLLNTTDYTVCQRLW